MLPLRHIRTLSAVAQAGGVRPSSETLRRAASAVSRAVALLEAMLGMPLFERKGRHDVRAQAVGRSPYLQSVHVDDADHLLGQIVPVRIEQGNQNSLKGSLAEGTLKQPRSASAASGNKNGA